MKRTTLLQFLTILPVSAMPYTTQLTVDIENELDVDRKDSPVVIDLHKQAPGKEITYGRVTDGEVVIPCQIDDMDRDGIADELAFVIDVPANGKRKLMVEISDEKIQEQYEPRVWGAFKIRTHKAGVYADAVEVTVPGTSDFYTAPYGHGPMFESELVGYRVYYNSKQTVDPYGKFNPGLELRECLFYPSDQQLAAGFGDDVLIVANSCGIGSFKGWDGNTTTHIEPVRTRTERLIATGPVRTIAEAEVAGWEHQGTSLDMVNRYTLYAGHRDLQIDVEFKKPLADQTFATGVMNILGGQTVSYSDHDGLVGSWGTHWPVNDTIKYAKETVGIATHVPGKYIVDEIAIPSDFLYVISAPGQKNLRYHTMFTSCKETFGYPDSDAWFAYLPQWRKELDSPLKINITK